ncbi:acyl-CoA-like ligand-binding transcription factor [Rhodococcus koreensis]
MTRTGDRTPAPSDRGGRPAATSAHELAAVAQRLFLTHGFEQTSVDDIAAEVGISRRTFFRYFPSKADVLWVESDAELARLCEQLSAGLPAEPYRTVVTRAVIGALHVPEDQHEWARHRAQLVLSVPAVQVHAAARHAAWRAAATEFAGIRSGEPATELFPTAVGYAVVAAVHAAHEFWLTNPGVDLDEALARSLDLLLPPEPAAR